MSDSENEGHEVEKHVKIVVMGETNVGKTSLIKRYCFDEFSRYYTQTVGADFYLKRLNLPGEPEITVRLTDVGGFEFKGPMLKNYLFNVNLLILVYDISNVASFDFLPSWLNQIDGLLEKRPLIAILGNKCDVEHHRNVKRDDVKRFATNHNLRSFLVSAKTGEGVTNCFLDLISDYLGVKLLKNVKEQQPIVRAEIMPPSARVVMKTEKIESTSVCTLN